MRISCFLEVDIEKEQVILLKMKMVSRICIATSDEFFSKTATIVSVQKSWFHCYHSMIPKQEQKQEQNKSPLLTAQSQFWNTCFASSLNVEYLIITDGYGHVIVVEVRFAQHWLPGVIFVRKLRTKELRGFVNLSQVSQYLNSVSALSCLTFSSLSLSLFL